MLIEKSNIDINQKEDKLFGKTALIWASYKGHKEIVKMLEARSKRDSQ